MNLTNYFNQQQFDQYVAYLKSTGLSLSSIQRKLSSIATFQKFLVKKNIIPPLKKINLPLIPQATPSVKKNKFFDFFKKTFTFKNYSPSQKLYKYLLISSLIIIVSGIGVTLYRQAITKAKKNLAYTTASSPVYANRFLSFQGRLTDSAGNPITSSTAIVFELYNTESVGTGTSLYTSTVGNSQTVLPDDNGIFSVTIGKTHGTEIPNSVFTENSAVYLQITAGGEVMDPRQPIATVAYAINAETLQGLPPSASGLKDTVLVIDGDGNLNLGETSPTIKSTSGTLGIEGQAILLTASNGSGGDIEINPDASGIIKLTTEGTGSTAVGGFINATNANLSTGNLFNANINNTNRGYNFISFNNYDIGTTSSSTRFSIDAYGNTFIGGTLSPTTISIGNTILTSSAYELNLLDGLLPTNGSIIYGNGSNLSNSSVGTSGQVLMSNGAAAPTWINSNAVGTTYSSGIGLTLSSSNVFSLNLGSTNTWTGLHTFSAGATISNLSVGGTFLSVGSTNLVTNLNANYLNGIASNEFVGIGQTGNFITTLNNGVGISITGTGVGRSIAVDYDATKLALTGNKLTLNLGSTNTWTALQNFSAGIGVSGTTNLTNNLNVGGTSYFAGNVGIGTTNPLALLDINGTVKIISSELVTNGTFTGNAIGWTLTDGAVYDTNNVTVTSGGEVSTNFNISNGKTYLLTFTLSNVVDDSVYIYFSNANYSNYDLLKNGTHSITFTGNQDGVETVWFSPWGWNTGSTWTIDDVSINEISSNSPALKITGFDGKTALSLGEYSNGNTALGLSSFASLLTGFNNSAFGTNSLANNTNGEENSAFGAYSLNSNTTGDNNIAFGGHALRFNTYGDENSAVGYQSLYSNNGDRNSAQGYQSLYSNTDGNYNSGFGRRSLYRNSTGNYNTALGNDAGSYIADGITNNTSPDNSVYLGALTRSGDINGDAQNEIVIGYDANGLGSDSVVLGNDSIAKTILKGNVGLGTTAPSKKLDVIGDGSFSTNLNVGGTLTLSQGANNGYILTSDASGNAYWGVGSTASGSTYTASTGITLVANDIQLNLGYAPTWTSLHTFSAGATISNLSVGGTFLSVGSTNLVTNLNANYLNGIASNEFVGIGQTGNFITTLNNGVGISITGTGVGRSIAVDYDATKLALTGNKLTLNLGSTNTWTALQNFSAGATISNLSIGGTLTLSQGANNGYILTSDASGNAYWGVGSTASGSTYTASTGITLVANDIQLNLGYAPTWTGLHTFSAGATVSTNLTVGGSASFGGDIDMNDFYITNGTQPGNSNFIGYQAGLLDIGASYSNFIGYQAGIGATNAYRSNFLGQNAGQNARNAYYSNFFGYQAGLGATGANNSNFFGYRAGNGANRGNESNFLGNDAGLNATAAFYSNFFGTSAGSAASSANDSNFFGYASGQSATNASNSNFFGNNSGIAAVNASTSNFFGYQAGFRAVNASNSNFFGNSAGIGASNASYSNFIGYNAGQYGIGASSSNFIGRSAGSGATMAANSIFIGSYAGYNDTVNTGSTATSIAIGRYAGTGSFKDSIALGHGVINTAEQQANIGNVLYLSGIYNSDTQSGAALATGKVGIGTTNPLYTLDVAGDIKLTGQLFVGTGFTGSAGQVLTSTGVGLSWTTITSGLSSVTNGLQLISSSVGLGGTLTQDTSIGTSSFSLSFLGLGNTQSLYLDSNGSIGIGTTDLSGKFTVAGSSGSSRSVSIDNREIKFRGDGVAHMSILGPDTGNSFITFQNTSGNSNTGTAGTDLFTILSSGNIGIGTTNPSQRFQVTTSGANDVQYGIRLQNPNNSTTGASIGIAFANDTDGTLAKGGLVYTGRNSYGKGDFLFLQNTNDDISVPTLSDAVMTITNGGNVGIGTTTPTQKLSVVGNGSFSASLSVGTSLAVTQTSYLIGNVGIGITASPTAGQLLSVGSLISANSVGEIRASSIIDTEDNTAFLDAANSSSTAASLSLAATGSIRYNTSITNTHLVTGAASRIQNYSNGLLLGVSSSTTGSITGWDSNLFLATSGNVGIGTTNPTHKLSIGGASSTISNTSGDITINSASNNISFSGDNLININNGLFAGNVGIGTTSPTSKLHVVGDGNITGNLNVGGTGYFAGNVGIGTTNPTSKLDLKGVAGDPTLTHDTASLLSLNNISNNLDLVFGQMAGSPYTSWIQSRNEISDGSSYPIALNPLGGNVGIGTTNPGYKLDVNGTSNFVGNISKNGTLFGALNNQVSGRVRVYEVGCASGYASSCDTGTDGWIDYANALASDSRLKTIIAPVTNVLDKLQKIQAYYHTWNDNYMALGLPVHGSQEIGVIAQTVQEQFPELVFHEGPTDTYLHMDYQKFTAVLLEGVKELDNKIDGLFISDNGQIAVNFNVSDEVLASLGYSGAKNEIETATYNLTDSLGNTITRIGQFQEIASAKIKAGLISAKNIIADNIVTKNLISQKVTTDNIISPLGNIDHLTTKDIQSTNIETENLVAQNIQTTEVVTNDLTADNATISGTLYADNIISREGSFGDLMTNKISSLREELQKIIAKNETTPSALLAESNNWSTNIASDSATINGDLNLSDNLVVGSQLLVNGNTQLGNTFINGIFNAGEIAIKDNFIETTNSILYIQPSQTGSVHVMGDTLVIADNGEVTVNGNLSITGSFAARNITADEITTNKLTANKSILNDISSTKINIATDSASTIIASNSDINIATNSAKVNSNATAGTATLPAGITELIISTDKVTQNSMVYLTPLGSTQNQVLYVKSKDTSSFTISLDNPLSTDLSINWWIIN